MSEQLQPNIIEKLCDGCMESRQGGRSENQDRVDFCYTAVGTLVIVCDGMGGGPSGSVASSEAIQKIKEFIMQAKPGILDGPQLLTKAIQEANLHLRTLQAEHRELEGMGTTCVCLLLNRKHATVAHVGDSRLYQMRFGHKEWRTWDHSAVMDKVKEDHGGKTEGRDVDADVEEARLSSFSNVITRAIGVTDEVTVETHILPYEKGDLFALCTDGVWGAMPEKELILDFCHTPELGGALYWTMDHVEQIGRDNGQKHDNYTLALLRTTTNSYLKVKMNRKARLIILSLLALLVICLIGLCTVSVNSISKNAQIEELKSSLYKTDKTIEGSTPEEAEPESDNQKSDGEHSSDTTSLTKDKTKNFFPGGKSQDDKKDLDSLVESADTISKMNILCASVINRLFEVCEWCKNNPKAEIKDSKSDQNKQKLEEVKRDVEEIQKLCPAHYPHRQEVQKECHTLLKQLDSPKCLKKENERKAREGQYNFLISYAKKIKNYIE